MNRKKESDRMLELSNHAWDIAVAEARELVAGWNEDLFRSIVDLDLSPRPAKVLHSLGIKYVSQLVKQRESDLLRIKTFGRRELNEVKSVLSELGLHIGMELPGFIEPEDREAKRAAHKEAFLQEVREYLEKEYEKADAIAAPLFGAQWSAAQAEEEDFLKEMETLITKEGKRADAIAAPLFAAQWSAGQAEE